MVNLSDGTLWTKIFQQQYVAQVDPNNPNKFLPIPLILFPGTFDIHSVAIECQVANSKNSWTYGGKVYQAILASSESDIGYFSLYKSYDLRINDTTLIQFQNYSEYFKILYKPASWFKEILLTVWTFNGSPPTDDTQQQLDAIKTQLDRIEQSLNTTAG